jgi:hypothetical protein
MLKKQSTFATLIKSWDIERAAPLTYQFLDHLTSQGIGKKENNYYLFKLNTLYPQGIQETAFNMCVNALINKNKYNRRERYEYMMFTKD